MREASPERDRFTGEIDSITTARLATTRTGLSTSTGSSGRRTGAFSRVEMPATTIWSTWARIWPL